MKAESYDELDRLETTHWWFKGMREITARLMPAALACRGDLLILEGGCGVGGNMRAMAARGTIIGVDFSPFALRYASRVHLGRLVRASVEDLPYADHSFDLVTSFDVVSSDNVRRDDRVFREFARVLRPGGYLLLRTAGMKNLNGAHDCYIGHTRRYSRADLRAMLVQAGLEPLRLTYANSMLLPLVFPMRKLQLLRMRLTGAPPGSDIVPLPGPLNALLLAALRFEAWWIGRGGGFPAGVSIYGLATKPGTKGIPIR